MSKKHFTFLYVPKQNEGLKTVRIAKWLVWTFAGTVGFLALASTVAVIKYADKFQDTYRLASLEDENSVLRAQLDDFESEMDRLERQVQQNFDFQKKARILAELEELNDDVAEVGVGGPNYGFIQSLSTLDPDTKEQVTYLREDIDKLLRQAKLQSDVYDDIIEKLAAEKQLLDTTPSIRPVRSGYLTSRFGRRIDPFTGRSSWHRGVDYSVRLGTPIHATADGIVTFVGKWGGFGNTVELSHGNGYVTRYAHNSKLLVKKGQKVTRGDVIARAGKSGRSTATHLHYEVIFNGQKKNPLNYVLPGKEITD